MTTRNPFGSLDKKARIVWSVEWRNKKAEKEGYKQFPSEKAARAFFERCKKAGKPAQLRDETGGFCCLIMESFDWDRAPSTASITTKDGIQARIGEKVYRIEHPRPTPNSTRDYTKYVLEEVIVKASYGYASVGNNRNVYREPEKAIQAEIDRLIKGRERINEDITTLEKMLADRVGGVE